MLQTHQTSNHKKNYGFGTKEKSREGIITKKAPNWHGSYRWKSIRKPTYLDMKVETTERLLFEQKPSPSP